MDESTLNDESGTFDLPDGLLQFRMNLVELLVDICQLLRPATFVQRVLIRSYNLSLYGSTSLKVVLVDDISWIKLKPVFCWLNFFFACSSICFIFWSKFNMLS